MSISIGPIGPILRSLRHHKGTFALLVLEVAFGFVILVHSFIAARYYHRLSMVETGMPVDSLVFVERRFLHPRPIEAARAEQRSDLAALARVGGVEAAAALDSLPLPDSATFPTVLHAADGRRAFIAWTVRATSRVVGALGLRLIAGHGFDAPAAPGEGSGGLLITRGVAVQLFGQPAAALGRRVDAGPRASGVVVGVVEGFAFRGTAAPQANSVIVAQAEPVTEQGLVYVLRAAPQRRAAAADEARRVLAGAPGAADSITSVSPLVMADMRFVRIARGAVLVLAWTGFLVVAVALAGSLALSSFSVTERIRQIGMRRALGARRGEIIGYFLLENLVVTSLGLTLGFGLAAALNLLLRTLVSEIELTGDLVLLSMAVFVFTGLASALVPARRAAAIPPWAATRTL
jgi:putative ABC transport system permease protein